MLANRIASVFCPVGMNKLEEDFLVSLLRLKGWETKKLSKSEKIPHPKPDQILISSDWERWAEFLDLGQKVILVGRLSAKDKRIALDLGFSMFWNLGTSRLEEIPCHSFSPQLPLPLLALSQDRAWAIVFQSLGGAWGIPIRWSQNPLEAKILLQEKKCQGLVLDVSVLAGKSKDSEDFFSDLPLGPPYFFLEDLERQGLLTHLQKTATLSKILLPKKDFLPLFFHSLPWKREEISTETDSLFLGSRGSLKLDIHPKWGLQNWELDWENRPNVLSAKKTDSQGYEFRLKKLFEWLFVLPTSNGLTVGENLRD